ncbi:MAG: hypothetical protein FJW21_05980 [Acidimicrobiia bacterium]|nr:hypothetical protein [Acidimicrobiia bacterium]
MSGLVDLRAVRIAASAIVAGALCVVLATRVFTEFDAVRVKLVTLPVPAVDGTVRIDTSHDARTAQLSAPVALIAVLHNSLPAQQTVAIEVDDQPVCTATIAPLTSRRLDCVVSTGWVRGPAHQILLTGEGPDWSLEFLEIATHHGSSSRLFPFHVLPNVNADFHRPNWVVVGVTWLVLWGILLVRPATTWSRRVVLVHRAVVAAGAVLAVAMVVSPWVSSFLLMMPASSFVELLAVVLAPQVWHLGTIGGGVVPATADARVDSGLQPVDAGWPPHRPRAGRLWPDGLVADVSKRVGTHRECTTYVLRSVYPARPGCGDHAFTVAQIPAPDPVVLDRERGLHPLRRLRWTQHAGSDLSMVSYSCAATMNLSKA